MFVLYQHIKWTRDYPTIALNWSKIFNICHFTVNEPKIRFFQFRFIHRILSTNDYLYKLGYIESPKCSFCKCNDKHETLRHLFWDCSNTRNFWNNVQSYILKKEPFFSEQNIMWVFLYGDVAIHNFLILHAKYFIYVCRLQSTLPCHLHFFRSFTFSLQVEKEILLKRDMYDKFLNMLDAWPAFKEIL